jgi:uncharacterized protein involved in response to NO
MEGAGLILLLLALLFNLLPWPPLEPLVGGLLIAASVLAAIRLLRWQPWHSGKRADLLVLVLLGYTWLAISLLMLGLSATLPALPMTATLHALSIGALGSLTFGVMARTRLIYRFRDANARRWIHPLVLLISLAALARVLPPLLGLEQQGWLLFAATCWSLAFLAVLLWQRRDAHPASAR